VNKGNIFKYLIFILFVVYSEAIHSQTILPVPDHIVIAVFESRGYTQIIGSLAAPYMNSLADDSMSALFTNSYANTHPSQPNYLILYSGNTQGVTNDNVPVNKPFTTENLGRQLFDSGRSFMTYSEDLPSVGFDGATSGYYARKHNPAANWMGTGTNQIPAFTNQPFTTFPTSDFDSLPTVSFVIPNLVNDMHNGTVPTCITIGDTWLYDNINNYILWAKTHNSMFILTFDEENGTTENHITTIFTGPMVRAGQYSDTINHYSVLHTLEQMYGLPFVGNLQENPPITVCWITDSITGIPEVRTQEIIIYPNPVRNKVYIKMEQYHDAIVELYDLHGRIVNKILIQSEFTEVSIDNLVAGYYLAKIEQQGTISIHKIIIEK
jgi:phosphatidylinositol-3-phosphatase